MASPSPSAYLIRERETYRHLDLSAIYGYSDVPNNPPLPARTSRDSALTAFARLALLQVNTERAFVSLFDRRYEYFIAETTTLSTLRASPDKPIQESLLLCGLAIPHNDGVSIHTLEEAAKDLADSRAKAHDASRWKAPLVTISDVKAEPRFASSCIHTMYPDIRFYAGTAIRSPAGPFIGVLAVTDSHPRESLSAVEASFLQDLASTVMDHLVLVRYRQENERSQRMLRGLGSFVEGKATMAGLASDQQLIRSGGDGDYEGLLNIAQQAKMLQEAGHTEQEETRVSLKVQDAQSDSVPPFPLDGASMRDKQRSSSCSTIPKTPAPGLPAAITPTDSLRSSEPIQASMSMRTPESHIFSADAKSLTETPSPEDATAGFNNLFSRAANTIRESLGVEGVCFFDASIATFGGLVGSGNRGAAERASSPSSWASTSDSDNARSIRSSRSSVSRGTSMCKIFGFSTTNYSSINGDEPDAKHLVVPERFLNLLLRRYPEGTIFNFDESGIAQSDSESDVERATADTDLASASRSSLGSRPHQHSYTRQREPSFIIKIFPNARSVLAFPLWDSHRSRWFAGGVVWTRTPTRVFSVKGELSYLRAFGATIMAEVAKIDASKANQAKEDVLGSISHEMRSPLHGILGGVELLQHTNMDVFQNSTVASVQRCGVTLLDTVDHLLDYAGINNVLGATRSAQQQRGHRDAAARPGGGVMRLPGIAFWGVQVDAVIEEVIESIFAGHEFQMASDSLDAHQQNQTWKANPNVRNLGAEMQSKDRTTMYDVQRGKAHLKVILEIRPAASWKFSTQVGALRRIVMNVFGNALKYTAAGYVKVTVDQKSLANRDRPTSQIDIKVEDSGKGIHREYLTHHLFTPFLQEDSLTPGTGLGLSITHKIVKSLSGNICAQSEVGRGTTMTISLPMSHLTPAEASEDDDTFAALINRTRGLRVSLSGFDDTDGTPAASTASAHPTDWRLPKAAMVQVCRDWLHMEILPGLETDAEPDIYFANLGWMQEFTDRNEAGVIQQPVLVVCPSAAFAHELSTSSHTVERNGVFEYISQPCGPRKLAKTISLALDRWADIQLDLAKTSDENSRETSPAFMDTSIDHSGKPVNPSMPPSPESAPLKAQPPVHTPSPTPSTLPYLIAATDTAPFLVVDDNLINVRLLTTYISRQNLPVATATDGVLAVASYKAARGAFSCIFMDIQMPRLDGIAATQAIREFEAREGLTPVHIVMLTGLATVDHIREAKASGANDFFTKPVQLKKLNPILTQTRRVASGGHSPMSSPASMPV